MRPFLGNGGNVPGRGGNGGKLGLRLSGVVGG